MGYRWGILTGAEFGWGRMGARGEVVGGVLEVCVTGGWGISMRVCA